jgi:hypothetical protein
MYMLFTSISPTETATGVPSVVVEGAEPVASVVEAAVVGDEPPLLEELHAARNNADAAAPSTIIVDSFLLWSITPSFSRSLLGWMR